MATHITGQPPSGPFWGSLCAISWLCPSFATNTASVPSEQALCCPDTLTFTHTFMIISPSPNFYDFLPFPQACYKNMYTQVDFFPSSSAFFWSVDFIDKFFHILFFFLFLLLLEKGWRKSHLHYCPPCFSRPQETCLSQHQWSCGPVTH